MPQDMPPVGGYNPVQYKVSKAPPRWQHSSSSSLSLVNWGLEEGGRERGARGRGEGRGLATDSTRTRPNDRMNPPRKRPKELPLRERQPRSKSYSEGVVPVRGKRGYGKRKTPRRPRWDLKEGGRGREPRLSTTNSARVVDWLCKEGRRAGTRGEKDRPTDPPEFHSRATTTTTTMTNTRVFRKSRLPAHPEHAPWGETIDIWWQLRGGGDNRSPGARQEE